MTSAALKLEKAVRAFRFNNMPLPDPDPKLTADQVKEFYANIYPELTNAEIEGPTQKGAEIVYEFRKAVGTKGGTIDAFDDLSLSNARAGLAGIALIAEERDRQINKKGWTTEHDDDHSDHELAMAACAYAAPEPLYTVTRYVDGSFITADCFPENWDITWDKRKTVESDDPETDGVMPLSADEYQTCERITNLAKAGALIAAEIDRLIRKKAAAGND